MRLIVQFLFKPLISLVLIAVILASVADTKYSTEQIIRIKREPTNVFDNISILKNRKKWHPIFKEDIFAEVAVEETMDGTSKISWSSPKYQRNGNEKIEQVGDRLVEVKQSEPSKNVIKKLTYQVFKEEQNLTEVVLRQSNYFEIPYNLLALIRNDVDVENEAVVNLKSLKKYTESQVYEDKKVIEDNLTKQKK